MTGSLSGKRIAILSSASGGGAGIAAKRVHDALCEHSGAEVDFVDMASLGERLPDDVSRPKSMSNRKISDTHFTIEYSGFYRGWLVDMLSEYDAVNVHWSSYLISLSELDELSRRGVPMLFTLHDFYYLTGGCHYPSHCTSYKANCQACPQVDVTQCDFSAIPENHAIKKRIFSRDNVHLAAPSEFLTNKAVEAGIVPKAKAHVLRNAYKPVGEFEPSADGDEVRLMLIADSLAERRKGMDLAIESLGEATRRLEQTQSTKRLVVDLVGNCPAELAELMANSGLDYKAHGKITKHEKLVDLYKQCQLLLSCSYEDNWPNILVEAGSYGCVPIVGPSHGCEEFVDVFGVGFVADAYSVDSFAKGIVSSVQGLGGIQVLKFSEQVRDMHKYSETSASYSSLLAAR